MELSPIFSKKQKTNPTSLYNGISIVHKTKYGELGHINDYHGRKREFHNINPIHCILRVNSKTG